MNPWDFLDAVKQLGIDPKKFIRRLVLVLMVLFPTFGGWMCTQALNREQAKTQAIGKVITQSTTMALTHSLPTLPPATPAPCRVVGMTWTRDGQTPICGQ